MIYLHLFFHNCSLEDMLDAFGYTDAPVRPNKHHEFYGRHAYLVYGFFQ
jgi:hypothetical protein